VVEHGETGKRVVQFLEKRIPGSSALFVNERKLRAAIQTLQGMGRAINSGSWLFIGG
jgi:hypothetical protein